MKKRGIVVLFLGVLILSATFASAFSFSDVIDFFKSKLTGKAINVQGLDYDLPISNPAIAYYNPTEGDHMGTWGEGVGGINLWNGQGEFYYKYHSWDAFMDKQKGEDFGLPAGQSPTVAYYDFQRQAVVLWYGTDYYVFYDGYTAHKNPSGFYEGLPDHFWPTAGYSYNFRGNNYTVLWQGDDIYVSVNNQPFQYLGKGYNGLDSNFLPSVGFMYDIN